MDRNSMRKLVEGQLLRLEGNAFQDCMDRLGLELYPGDYQPVRAAGPKGDTKNDGYCPKARIFFAAHATRGEPLARSKSKIHSDLEGCLKHHRDVKVWRFLTNDTMPGEIDQYIDNKLRPSHPGLIIEVWGLKTLANEICKLSLAQVDKIIDINLATEHQPMQVIPEAGKVALENSQVVQSDVRAEPAAKVRKRLTRALICFIEWVNAPVLPFPTASVLRKMLDEALQAAEFRNIPAHRRDGNGESVLIFDLYAIDSLPPSDSSAHIVRVLLDELDRLMSDFCEGKGFENPYPQIRLFSHEGAVTFDGSDYSGEPLEIMATIRKGMQFQDGLTGDFPGVIAITSGAVYREEILRLPSSSFFGEWIGLFTTDGFNGLHICFRVPRQP